jgi:hypothetical protein
MQTRFRRGRIQFPALCFAPLVVALTLLFVTGPAHAYPWMIKHGYTNCSGCHADPSGGELLTLYGHAISYEALSTKWGGNKEAARIDERRVAEAIAHAAGAKSAPKKKIAAEKVTLDDEPAPKGAAAPAKPKEAPAAAKPKEAAAPKEAPTPAPDAAAAEEKPEAVEAKDEVETKPAAKKPSEDDEEAAEEEGAEDSASASAEGEAAASASGSASGAEPSPFEGMSGLTGPLFGLLSPKESLLIGGSWRLATTFKPDATKKAAFFPMQLDMYGQIRFLKNFRASLSLGAAKVPAGSPHARAAQVTRNQGDGYNLISRTHWVGFDFGDGAHLIRAGRINLPFGIRMSEHVMWVREKTQTDRESDQQHGVALSLNFDKLRLELMGIAGNFQVNPDEFRERGYSGYAELVVGEKTAVGLNSLYTEAKNDRVYTEGLRTARSANGLFARTAPSTGVAILAEADLLTRSRRELGYVGFLQVDGEVLSGLHLIGTAELLDAGFPKGGGPARLERSAGVGEPAFGAWLSLQWFFLPHFDMRTDAIIRQEKMVITQLHVYL